MIEHGYKNLWMSPNIAIIRLSSLIKEYGIETVLKKNEFKHEREAWVGALFLLGLRNFDKNEYWLEVETIEDTPDIYGYYLENIKGNNHRWVCNLEIVEWEEHSGDIIEIIENKSKKQYPPYFYLLVYARKRGSLIDYDNTYEEINKIKVPFAQIWILAASSNNNDYHLTKIYPEKDQIRFNLDMAITSNIKQVPFATFLKREKGTKKELLGEVYVPLPRL